MRGAEHSRKVRQKDCWRKLVNHTALVVDREVANPANHCYPKGWRLTIRIVRQLFWDFSRRKLVHITPHPRLSRFDGSNQGMLNSMEVFRSMLVLGGVTAAYVATLQAKPQMDPRVA